MQYFIRYFLLSFLFGAGAAVADVEFHKDVMPLINAKCVTCHAVDGVSFSFEDPDETYNYRMAIALAVQEDRMPPWLAEPGHQSYVDDYSLSTTEKSLIAEWAAAEYPRSGSAPTSTVVTEAREFEADWSVNILADGPYLPDQDNADDYRCFIVDWPYDTDNYITGFMAEPGNTRVAHHIVMWMISPGSVELVKTLSEEEEGQGHQCFSGPLPDSAVEDEVRQRAEERFPGGLNKYLSENFWLSHWAPGMYGIDFPQDTGILMKPGSAVVVQMHYYTAFAPGETDEATTMHFKLADTVEKPSINYPLSQDSWLFSKDNNSMQIQPHTSNTFEFSIRFNNIARYMSSFLDIDLEEISAVELQSANIHMHSYGASGIASLLDENGQKETLLNIPRWDHGWQRDFMFTEGKLISRSKFEDTRLLVECTFSNDTDRVVFGGYGSDEEMCFNFSYMSVVRGKAEPTEPSSQ